MRKLPLLLCGALLGCPGPMNDMAEPSDDGAAPADLGDPGPGDLRPSFVFPHADINHILSTGQSLSVGSQGAPPLSTTQPFRNVTFNTSVLSGGANLTSFIPLSEKGVETMSSGMANLITRMAREEVFAGGPMGKDGHDLLVSCHGSGGKSYSELKKGTVYYQHGMAQVQAGKMIAAALGKTYEVRAVTNVHGETDHLRGNQGYLQDLFTWQADYEADVNALAGRRGPLPMFHTQMSSFTKYNSATSRVPQAQLDASLERPERHVMVGPKYFLSYVADGVHLSNEGYRHMGEYYAKAYRQVILEGRPFSPLRPLRASRAEATITVDFHVPAPPLVLDTRLVSDPGNYGFEYFDESAAPPRIVKVALAGPDRVALTLERAPTGKDGRVRYAYTGKVGAAAGPMTGARGNLRDSDGTVSRHGYSLHNWCVHFDLPIR